MENFELPIIDDLSVIVDFKEWFLEKYKYIIYNLIVYKSWATLSYTIKNSRYEWFRSRFIGLLDYCNII